MSFRSLPMLSLALLACGSGSPKEPVLTPAEFEVEAVQAAGMVAIPFPEADPGAPLYTRITPLSNQVFIDGDLVAVPVYREPACIPPDFDLFVHMDPPGSNGPGAFACPLLITGTVVIEKDAPPGTFPLRAIATGAAQVWFVDRTAYDAATADGTLLMSELLALAPLRGTATEFTEMLAPRPEQHQVIITSRGRLQDGRAFQFNVNHAGTTTRSIRIRIS